MSHLTVAEACAAIRERFPGVTPVLMPRDVSDTIYRSRLLCDLPVLSGRRLIPEAQMDVLIAELKRANKLPGGGR